MSIINPTSQFGLKFQKTVGRAKNASGSTIGMGYALVPDFQLSVAADSSPMRAIDPGWSGSVWYNLVSPPVNVGAHRSFIPFICTDREAAGIGNGVEFNFQCEGLMQAWVRSVLTAANSNNKRGAAIGLPSNTTNVNRFLCNSPQDFVSAATYAGTNPSMTKKAGIVLQDLAQGTPLAADSAEGAYSATSNGGTQYMGGTVGAAYTGAASSTITLTTANYILQWCDILLIGIAGQ